MATNNNPLRQYFRRPAIYMRLPSNGIGYRPGALAQTETGEYPVYAMTAIDEITVNTPDGLFNGQAVVDVIKSCVPGITDPWALLGSDLDAVLIGMKIASSGAKMEIDCECPQCANITKFDINLTGLLNSMQPGNYAEEIGVGELYFRFRSLTYRELNALTTEQFEFQRKFMEMNEIEDLNEKARLGREALRALTDTTMQMVSAMVEYVRTPEGMVSDQMSIYEFMQNCDRKTYEKIREHATNLKASSEIKPLKVKCPDCSNEYDQAFTLNASTFFA